MLQLAMPKADLFDSLLRNLNTKLYSIGENYVNSEEFRQAKMELQAELSLKRTSWVSRLCRCMRCNGS
jgi:hypothetical protein